MTKSKALTYASPIGTIRILANKNGVERLESAGSSSPIDDESDLGNKQDIDDSSADFHAIVCKTWLETYFVAPEKLNEVDEPCLDLHQRDGFQERVWLALKDHTKPGQVITYGDLAALAGSPNAAQAVGTAMRRNPLPFIVPCHRVLPKNGGLGNYSFSGGSETKKWLLDHEKICADK